ncbi:MAG: separase/separin [Amphiamblys sp. WSBS2006]|nr:MAG: separase/separin [Amphiamblys sp. WSBS2006]
MPGKCLQTRQKRKTLEDTDVVDKLRLMHDILSRKHTVPQAKLDTSAALLLHNTKGRVQRLFQLEPRLFVFLEKMILDENESHAKETVHYVSYFVAKEAFHTTENSLFAQRVLSHILEKDTKELLQREKTALLADIVCKTKTHLEFCRLTLFTAPAAPETLLLWTHSWMQCTEGEMEGLLEQLSPVSRSKIGDSIGREHPRYKTAARIVGESECKGSTEDIIETATGKMLGGRDTAHIEKELENRAGHTNTEESFAIELFLGCASFYAQKTDLGWFRKALSREPRGVSGESPIVDLSQAVLSFLGELHLQAMLLERCGALEPRQKLTLQTLRRKKYSLEKTQKNETNTSGFYSFVSSNSRGSILSLLRKEAPKLGLEEHFALVHVFVLEEEKDARETPALRSLLCLLNAVSVLEKIARKILSREKTPRTETLRLETLSLTFTTLKRLGVAFWHTGHLRESRKYLKKGLSMTEDMPVQNTLFEIENKTLDNHCGILTPPETRHVRAGMKEASRTELAFVEVQRCVRLGERERAETLCELIDHLGLSHYIEKKKVVRAGLLLAAEKTGEAGNLLGQIDEGSLGKEDAALVKHAKMLCGGQNTDRTKTAFGECLEKGPLYLSRHFLALLPKSLQTQAEHEAGRNPSFLFETNFAAAYRQLEHTQKTPAEVFQKIEALGHCKNALCSVDFQKLHGALGETWTVLSIDYDAGRNRFQVTRYRNTKQDFPVLSFFFAPLENPAEKTASIDSVVEESQKMLRGPPTATKTAWWSQRHALNEKLKALVLEFEEKCFWAGDILLSSETKGAALALKERLAESILLTADEAALLLSASRSSREKLSMVFDNLPATQRLGGEEREKTIQTIAEYRQAEGGPDQTVVLVLGNTLCSVPWEALSFLDKLPVTRVPTIAFLNNLLERKQTAHPARIGYILNPEGDLKHTQTVFEDYLAQKGWQGIKQRPPSESEFSSLLDSDVLVYFGHGGGEKYIRSATIKKRTQTAIALLLGCSSGRLSHPGVFDCHGTPYNYLIGGSQCVLATLWDVTDKDVDRFTKTLLEEWLENGRPLSAAAALAKESCRLSHLTAAALVLYGIPV